MLEGPRADSEEKHEPASDADAAVVDSLKASLAEPDVDVLTFNVSDDVLERAAVVTDGQAITIGHCTHWWHCSWPM